VKRLAEVGDWLKAKGETIYGTRGGPITPRPWGVTTQKGSRVFVHVLGLEGRRALSAELPEAGEVRVALRYREPVRFTVEKDALLLQLDPAALDPLDTIVVLELQK